MIAGILFVGLAAFTVVNGELRLPFGGGVLFAYQGDPTSAAGPPALPKGTVAVFACPRRLPAFTKITREHLLTNDGLHTVPVVEPAIGPNGLFRADVEGLKRLLGRVLRRDKPVNFAFTEKDLLPRGTRAGPSAGIPPGKRGIWVDTAEVQGLAGARAQDLVDLVAARATTAPKPMGINVLGNVQDPVLKARLENFASSSSSDASRSWVVARGAMIVAPMRIREIINGNKTTTVEEVFLAMAPDEVADFSKALAQEVTILAAPRSGQPESTTTEISDPETVDVNAELRRMLTGAADSEPTFGMVEVIRGSQRQTVTVPRAPLEKDKR